MRAAKFEVRFEGFYSTSSDTKTSRKWGEDMSGLSLRSAGGSATTTTVRFASAHDHRRPA